MKFASNSSILCLRSESIVKGISLVSSISSIVAPAVSRSEKGDPNEEFTKMVWIGVWLARPNGMDFCKDQDVVSATSVILEGASSIIVEVIVYYSIPRI